MSRYIIIPNGGDSETDSYILLPTEGFDKKVKEVRAPRGLNSHQWMFYKTKNSKKLRNLLFKLAKSPIIRTRDGYVSDGREKLLINYDSAVLNSSNGVFTNSLERFYCMLRKNGITF